MQLHPNYLFKEIQGTGHLLPFGQALADHSSSISLNGTGTEIVRLLAATPDPATLIQKLEELYGIPVEEHSSFSDDIMGCLRSLQILDCIVTTENNTASPGSSVNSEPFDFDSSAFLRPVTDCIHKQYVKIAGLTLCIQEDLPFTEHFLTDFICSEAAPQQTVVICRQIPVSSRPQTHLIATDTFHVYRGEDFYFLNICTEAHALEVFLRHDGTYAQICYNDEPSITLREELFQALRTVFLYLAQQHGRYMLHSASVLYRGKAWLFSGPSGTGKSTHTNLWYTLLHTPRINGDLNLLALSSDGIPVIYGTPWCGTSGICDTKKHLLGGIVLLKQSSRNSLLPLRPDQKELFVLQRLISPFWEVGQLEHALAFLEILLPHISVFRLGCNISADAVTTIRTGIDETYQN